ncbi:acyltransferase family protein [Xanthocytophaga flava]|uniref:acyltransferase family protein n=1 Tax=Xanthocytophaga flava TaxID=3048013 RepID=UPI0028D4F40E|nr:acyltransferase [Xanthocytophaga flavus]MDJ1468836.1 acyltransferase [Xanthocytophaga flavus]
MIKRYTELDSLRGIAAILVVFFHFTRDRDEALLGFKLGVTGVDLFFLISGFVIFMSINNISTAKEFIVNRFSRLYPTYWSCVSFTAILVSLSPSIYATKGVGAFSMVRYLGNMTMFQYYLRMPNLDGPYWTMIIEMVFYLTILLLFVTKQLKNIEIWGVVGIILACVLDYCEDHYTTLYKMVVFVYPLIHFWPLFFSGILFFKIMTERTAYVRRYVMVCICFLLQRKLYAIIGHSAVFISKIEYIVCLLCYFLLFILFVNKKLNFIVNKVTLYLGTISYALYLCHEYLSYNLLIPYLTKNIGLNFWIAAFICLTVTIFVASLITFYIEEPFRKRIKKLFASSSSKKVQAYFIV